MRWLSILLKSLPMVALAAALAGCPNREGEPEETAGKESLKLLSYNIYYNFNYNKSLDAAVEFLAAEAPDILLVQEMKMPPGEYAELAKKWGHNYCYRCRDDYPLMSVAISSRLPIEFIERRNAGMYHGYLHCKIGDIHLIASHLSAAKEEEKVRDARILAQLVRPLIAAGEKVILTGDMNSLPDAKPVKILEQTGLVSLGDREPTFHSFLASNPASDKIDYIFVSPNLVEHCSKPEVLRSEALEKISDHYPLRMFIEEK